MHACVYTHIIYIGLYFFWVAFHHLGPTFIDAYSVTLLQTWLIKTEGNMRVIWGMFLGQGRLCSLSVSSKTSENLMFYKHVLFIEWRIFNITQESV